MGHTNSPVRAYLDQDAIIDIALKSGAEAIHPGKLTIYKELTFYTVEIHFPGISHL